MCVLAHVKNGTTVNFKFYIYWNIERIWAGIKSFEKGSVSVAVVFIEMKWSE